MKTIEKPTNEITLEDIIPILSEEIQEKSVLRTLNANLSIRKGKYGPYIYYKTPSSAKPQFFNLKKYKGNSFDDDVKILLEWIKDTYQVE